MLSVATSETFRDVVVGRNSAVWSKLAQDPDIRSHFKIAIGHREVPEFKFQDQDRVWIFSYSNNDAENRSLLSTIGKSVREIVYISSATTNIGAATRCYVYPRVKHDAEQAAQQMLNARILTIGVMHDDVGTLPAGPVMATRYGQLKSFLLTPQWPAERAKPTLLFSRVDRPFSSGVERFAYRSYAAIMALCTGWPCVLRPVDLVLRTIGWNWYGYLFLSNRKWISTTLS